MRNAGFVLATLIALGCLGGAAGCGQLLGLDDPKDKTDAAVGDGAAEDGAMQSDSGGTDGGGGGDARAAPTCIFDNDATTFDNCNFAP